MEKKSNSDILEIYRKSLPHGYIKKIAKESGVTVASVQCFLRGKTKSQKIELAILRKIAELKEEREELLKRAGLYK